MLHSQTYDTLTLDNDRVVLLKRTPTIGYAVTQSTENVKAFKVWTDEYVNPPKLTVVSEYDMVEDFLTLGTKFRDFNLATEIAQTILSAVESIPV